MHNGHDVDTLQPPFELDVLRDEKEADLATPEHIENLDHCMKATHKVFETFLAIDIDGIRALPTVMFVRTSYAAVGLIKMYLSFSVPGSKRSKVFNKNDLKVGDYLDRICTTLQSAGEGEKCRSAAKFGMILGLLREWFKKKQEEERTGTKPPAWQTVVRESEVPIPDAIKQVRAVSRCIRLLSD